MVSKELLEEIRHELVSITGLKAYDKCVAWIGYVEVFDEDIIELNYNNLIEKIDKELEK